MRKYSAPSNNISAKEKRKLPKELPRIGSAAVVAVVIAVIVAEVEVASAAAEQDNQDNDNPEHVIVVAHDRKSFLRTDEMDSEKTALGAENAAVPERSRRRGVHLQHLMHPEPLW